MSKSITICKWLVDVLKKNRFLTLTEIEDKWLNDENMEGLGDMSQRNFHRYKDKLLKEFGIKIRCTRDRGYAYYISNQEIFKENGITDWMLNTLAVDEKLHECLSMTDRIRLEPIPSGVAKLDVVTNAMLREKKLKFNHQKYASVTKNIFVVGVCGLILYNHRWYILGEFDDKQRYTFALDRLWEPVITSEDFDLDPNFDVNAYFEEIYGIYNSGDPIENIVLRAFGSEIYTMRDLPIHPSQKEIGAGDNYVDFMLTIRPNNELISRILSRQNLIKVLSPKHFQEKIRASIKDMAELYDVK